MASTVSADGDERKSYVKQFYQRAKQTLSAAERNLLHQALRDYHAARRVDSLVADLVTVLDTPSKLDLLREIRNLVPYAHLRQFDRLAPYASMATPLRLPAAKDYSVVVDGSSGAESADLQYRGDGVYRVVGIDNAGGGQMGFSVRGGAEHGIGVFISDVDAGSSADRAGLKPGDQIMEANNVLFDNISGRSVCTMLAGCRKLRMVVKGTGLIPGYKVQKEQMSWFDTKNKRVVMLPGKDVNSVTPHTGGTTSIIDLTPISKSQPLGFHIRGGSEYGLGIYVSKVDPGSLAEARGLREGQQIVDVNGHGFHEVSHRKAVAIFKSERELILTVQEVGHYPAYKEMYAEYNWESSLERPKHKYNREIKTIKLVQRARQANYALRKTASVDELTASAVRLGDGDASSIVSNTATRYAGVTTPKPNGAVMYDFDDGIVDAPSADRNARRPKSIAGYLHPEDRSVSFARRRNAQQAKRQSLSTGDIRSVGRDSRQCGDRLHESHQSIKDRVLKAMRKYKPKGGDAENAHAGPSTLSKIRAKLRKSKETDIHRLHPAPQLHPVLPPPPPPLDAPQTRRDELSATEVAAGKVQGFERGMGTQLMHQSSVVHAAPSVAMIEDMAARLLSPAESDALLYHVRRYQYELQVEAMVLPVLNVLDSPEKLLLLREIRGIIQPSDIEQYDALVLPIELQAYEDLMAMSQQHNHNYEHLYQMPRKDLKTKPKRSRPASSDSDNLKSGESSTTQIANHRSDSPSSSEPFSDRHKRGNVSAQYNGKPLASHRPLSDPSVGDEHRWRDGGAARQSDPGVFTLERVPTTDLTNGHVEQRQLDRQHSGHRLLGGHQFNVDALSERRRRGRDATPREGRRRDANAPVKQVGVQKQRSDTGRYTEQTSDVDRPRVSGADQLARRRADVNVAGKRSDVAVKPDAGKPTGRRADGAWQQRRHGDEDDDARDEMPRSVKEIREQYEFTVVQRSRVENNPDYSPPWRRCLFDVGGGDGADAASDEDAVTEPDARGDDVVARSNGSVSRDEANVADGDVAVARDDGSIVDSGVHKELPVTKLEPSDTPRSAIYAHLKKITEAPVAMPAEAAYTTSPRETDECGSSFGWKQDKHSFSKLFKRFGHRDRRAHLPSSFFYAVPPEGAASSVDDDDDDARRDDDYDEFVILNPVYVSDEPEPEAVAIAAATVAAATVPSPPPTTRRSERRFLKRGQQRELTVELRPLSRVNAGALTPPPTFKPPPPPNKQRPPMPPPKFPSRAPPKPTRIAAATARSLGNSRGSLHTDEADSDRDSPVSDAAAIPADAIFLVPPHEGATEQAAADVEVWVVHDETETEMPSDIEGAASLAETTRKDSERDEGKRVQRPLGRPPSPREHRERDEDKRMQRPLGRPPSPPASKRKVSYSDTVEEIKLAGEEEGGTEAARRGGGTASEAMHSSVDAVPQMMNAAGNTAVAAGNADQRNAVYKRKHTHSRVLQAPPMSVHQQISRVETNRTAGDCSVTDSGTERSTEGSRSASEMAASTQQPAGSSSSVLVAVTSLHKQPADGARSVSATVLDTECAAKSIYAPPAQHHPAEGATSSSVASPPRDIVSYDHIPRDSAIPERDTAAAPPQPTRTPPSPTQPATGAPADIECTYCGKIFSTELGGGSNGGPACKMCAYKNRTSAAGAAQKPKQLSLTLARLSRAYHSPYLVRQTMDKLHRLTSDPEATSDPAATFDPAETFAPAVTSDPAELADINGNTKRYTTDAAAELSRAVAPPASTDVHRTVYVSSDGKARPAQGSAVVRSASAPVKGQDLVAAAPVTSVSLPASPASSISPLTVQLPKSKSSLGISISGGSESKTQPMIKIDRVFAGGAAADSHFLQAGCELLSVDGHSLKAVTHVQAVEMIRRAYRNKKKPLLELVIVPTSVPSVV